MPPVWIVLWLSRPGTTAYRRHLVVAVTICSLQTLVSSLCRARGQTTETTVSLLMVPSFGITCGMTCSQQTYPWVPSRRDWKHFCLTLTCDRAHCCLCEFGLYKFELYKWHYYYYNYYNYYYWVYMLMQSRTREGDVFSWQWHGEQCLGSQHWWSSEAISQLFSVCCTNSASFNLVVTKSQSCHVFIYLQLHFLTSCILLFKICACPLVKWDVFCSSGVVAFPSCL